MFLIMLRRDLQIFLTALLLSFACANPAFAHAHLVSSAPAANDMAMPAPTELRLQFSEGIELKFAKVTLAGSNKKAVATGVVKLDPHDDKLLIVPLAAPLEDGKYTVDWEVVSTDGHKTKGEYSFESMN
ncbi:copper homeostasis periplasmic binding protein CopC [Telmatospirillum sp.]|uniref:copper homeostasis periplasmic binding protein CopC n=1 Tax=Telmatospirillum sp. TaxID=2079197 RepID=UPI00284BD327|nr:copper homeostasis periplasmic binding protein CopC [Telmatospirillum sp.]MDR3440482.1 copper homeostasis periplasmic binding protein CopC [Telmatospirillum sp.]